MNRIAGRTWVVILLASLLLGGFVFFLVEFATQSPGWAVFPGSPHVYNGTNIDCGVATDRKGILLLNMEDGRTYSEDLQLRSSVIHWVGDREGSIDAPALASYGPELAGYDILNGVYNYGNDPGVAKLSISAAAQREALAALEGYKGTVAVYNYKTGELICAVTTPTYDPNNIPQTPLEGMYVNRFTQSTYTPGSIFKIVTVAAALETINDVQTQTFTCTGSYMIGADEITCEGVHGDQDLKSAFCNSCNCAFAQLALQLGGVTLERYAREFGITEPLSFDGITTAEGRFEAADAAQVNVAWSAVGQYNDQINPAAFLAFVGAVANDGKGTVPYLVKEISVGRSSTYKADTHTNRRIMSATTAKIIQEYMAFNVTEKYGSDNFPGLTVCAKTGTAEVGGGKKPNAMLTGFTQNENCPLAFIICVEDAGYGKTVCVPIASRVLSACAEAIK